MKKAVLAVVPSTIAFVERVVPYVNTSVCASSSSTLSLSSGAIWARPCRIPSYARSRLVSALPIRRCPRSSSTTTSVNVPPVSTEILNAIVVSAGER